MRKEISRPAEGEYFPFGRGDFFVREGGNFSSDKSFPPCGRKGSFLQRKITFPRQENFFSKQGKFFAFALKRSSGGEAGGLASPKRKGCVGLAWTKRTKKPPSKQERLLGGFCLEASLRREGGGLRRGRRRASVGKAKSLRRGYLISQAPPAQETAPSSSALVYCLPEKSTLFQSTGL